MATTLVLTRKPNALFQYGKLHGRFGTLIVLKGVPVTRVGIKEEGGAGAGGIEVPTGVLDLTAGGSVKEVKRYTTIERMDGYIQLHPQPETPYGITYETGNTVVAKLRPDGKCFRVHGGRSAQERGILIHQAPHVGWLIGCIGPRLWNDRRTYTETTTLAMNEMFHVVGPERASLFVLDW